MKLSDFTKDELIELIGIYSKNWLAMDGVWFQSVEQKDGMEAALYHDACAWERFTVVEARRIKAFLGLEEHPGLEGLEKALALRFYANINEAESEYKEGKLVYTMKKCHVQTARERKGMPWHACKPVGIIEYEGFAKTIDERIACRCLSCYPEITDQTCCCKWEFTLRPEKPGQSGQTFYGAENIFVPVINEAYPGIKTPQDLYAALSEVWCRETCTPRLQSEWTQENKTLGQCSVTAFLAQDLFGGKVYGIRRPGGNYHCYNEAEGKLFDLTSEQFGEEKLDYSGNPEQFRELHFAKAEKYERYLYLKEKLVKFTKAKKNKKTR